MQLRDAVMNPLTIVWWSLAVILAGMAGMVLLFLVVLIAMTIGDWRTSRRPEPNVWSAIATDWDGESYCCANGCRQPATVRVLQALIGDGHPIEEWRCIKHAGDPS